MESSPTHAPPAPPRKAASTPTGNTVLAAEPQAHSVFEATRGPEARPLLAHVPASTPYFMGSLEPLPKAWLAQSLERSAASLRARLRSLGRLQPPGQPDAGARLAVQFLKRAAQIDAPEKLAELGLAPGFRYALYGIGPAPAFRLELADPTRTRRVIEELARDSEVSLRELKFRTEDGFEAAYWEFSGTGDALVLAIAADQLVAGVVGGPVRDHILARLLGAQLPERSLREQREDLRALAASHKILPLNLGYVDFASLVQSVVEGRDPVGAAMGGAMGLAGDAQCARELRTLAETYPRLVLGAREFGTKRVRAVFVQETKPAVARELVRLSAPLPGIKGAVARTPLVDVGLSAQLGNLPDALASALPGTPYRCAYLRDLNDVSVASAGVANVVPAHAVRLVLSTLRYPKQPSDAALVLGSSSPTALLSFLASSFPPLSQLPMGVGKTVRLKGLQGDLGKALGTPWLSMSKTALGAATGSRARAKVRKLVKAASEPAGALFLLRVDVAGLRAVLEEQGASSPAGPNPALTEFTRGFDELRTVSVMARATSRGLEIELATDLVPTQSAARRAQRRVKKSARPK